MGVQRGPASTRVELVRKTYTQNRVIDRKLANRMELVKDDGIAAISRVEIDAIEFRFRQHVMATPPEKVIVRYPSTWWDAVKERFVPERFRRWFPVRMTVVEMEKYAVYPELPVPGSGGRSWIIPLMKLDHWEREYTLDGQD